MNVLYPLKFKPIFKEKIWGGQKIKNILNKDFKPLPNCGELWAMSGVQGDVSVVTNGFLTGNNLNELVEIYMDELVGDVVYQKFGNAFPILIKFLNSSDYLSVQVHPDDVLAQKRHNCMGKTEMWYIIDCDADSELIVGFKRGTNLEKYDSCMKEGSIKEILNHIKISKDDVFYIPAGRVHAIGKGVLLAEIQQTSDITYRIYDWDRVDEKGNSRELHTEMARDAINFKHEDDYYTRFSKINNTSNTIIDSEYFDTKYLPLNSKMYLDLADRDSFTVLVLLEGKCHLKSDDTIVKASMGECILLPNELNDIIIVPENDVKLLDVTLSQ